MDPAERPLRLAIVDDYAVVIAGVASFLADRKRSIDLGLRTRPPELVHTNAATPGE